MSNKLEVLLRLTDQFTKPIDKAEGKFRRFAGNLKASWKSVANLQNAIIGGSAVLAVRNLTQATMQMEALEAKMQAAIPVYGVSKRELAFVSEEADRLGLVFQKTAGEYATFIASATRSGLSLKQTRQIFKDISEAAVSLKLNESRVNLVFQALTQISSKGVVSMEELRRQLSDSLPGALQIGARAMGMTNQEFMKLVSTGEVLSSEFLPKFAAQVREELGGGFETASQQMQASLNRLSNAWFKLRAGLGFIIQGDLRKGITGTTSAINFLNEHMKELAFSFHLLITPVVIAFNGIQMFVDSLIFSIRTVYDIVELIIRAVEVLTETLASLTMGVGNVFSALVKRDFDALKRSFDEVPMDFSESVKELTHVWQRSINEYVKYGRKHDKNLEDIAEQEARLQVAYLNLRNKRTGQLGGADPKFRPGDPVLSDKDDKEAKKRLEAWRRLKQQLNDQERRWLEGKWRYEENIAKQILDTQQQLQESKINLMEDGANKELALLDLKYQKMRDGYEGNQIALKNIDEMYANERKAIMKSIHEQQLEDSRHQLNVMVGNLEIIATEWKEAAGLYKTIAIAETLWNTYAAAQASYKAMAHIYGVGPILGAAAAATATIAGLARVNKIRKTKFGTGVRSFRTSGPQMVMVGDNPGGIEEVDVRPVSSQNVNGPSASGGGNIIINVRDYTGGLVETLRKKLRSNEGDRLARELILRGTI